MFAPGQFDRAERHRLGRHPSRLRYARRAGDTDRIPVQVCGETGQFGSVPVQRLPDEAPLMGLVAGRCARGRPVPRLGDKAERLGWKVHRLREVAQLHDVVAAPRAADVLRYQRPIDTEDRGHFRMRGDAVRAHVGLDDRSEVRPVPRRGTHGRGHDEPPGRFMRPPRISAARRSDSVTQAA